jgi:hypothetical protein
VRLRAEQLEVLQQAGGRGSDLMAHAFQPRRRESKREANLANAEREGYTRAAWGLTQTRFST